MKKLRPTKDENLKMGPRADKKFEERDTERTKSSEKWDLNVLDPPSLSKR